MMERDENVDFFVNTAKNELAFRNKYSIIESLITKP